MDDIAYESDGETESATGESPPDSATGESPTGSDTSGGWVTDRRVKLSLTFVVAFCSIAYELVYSELLTVFYGGTVIRYSITIGLFMFSLGIGSILSSHLDDPEPNFLRTEVYLAIAGPAGAALIIGLNSVPDVTFQGKYALTLVSSHVPIVVVGLLSGFEVPLLNELLEHRERTVFGALGRLYPRTVVRRVLGRFFSVSEAEGRSFSEVLGVDYLGSLAGTVGYALVLYPRYGLVVTVLILGLLNALAALAFAGWTLWASDSLSRPSVGRWRAVLLVGLLVTGTYGALVANAGAVDRAVTRSYMADGIESEYEGPNQPDRAEITPLAIERTAYQRIFKYRRNISYHEGTETCLRLDEALQLCEDWARSYHSGLIDLPLSAYENTSSLDVLLVGGGDYIAVDHLRRYNVSVRQVDLDGEFLNHTKSRSYYEQFHDDAYTYDRLNTTVGDAYNFLRHTDERYDLIVLDIPGARSDDTLSLYSTEFYRSLRGHLTDRGVVVTWTYAPQSFAQHHKAYVNTVLAAGFDSYLSYSVYNDLDGDDEHERGERFYVLSPEGGPQPIPDLDRAKSPYLDAHAEQFEPFDWQSFPHYRGVEPNSVFDPNYDIIVDY